MHIALYLLLVPPLTLSAQTRPAIPGDVAAALRAHSEEMRRLSVPPPAAGRRDMPWRDLSPPDWNPRAVLERLRVDTLEDGDPRAPALMAEIRRTWDRAPALRSLDRAGVRLTGFPVMLDDGTQDTHTILLAPYYGACVHAPTPAANQMVHVRLQQPLPREMYQYPIWVEGTLRVRSTTTRHGRVVYAMEQAQWKPYPFRQYPMPQYQLPKPH